MNASEYANLDRIEQQHWYYAGKRELVRRWLSRVRPPAPADTLLDCGAGTGRFALEMQRHCQVLVLDDHEEALRLLRGRFRAEQVLSLSGDAVPLPSNSIEYVTALDVLCAAQLRRAAGMRSAARDDRAVRIERVITINRSVQRPAMRSAVRNRVLVRNRPPRWKWKPWAV